MKDTRRNCFEVCALFAVSFAFVACDSSPKPVTPVDLHTTSKAVVSSIRVGALEITSVKLVLGAASLGDGKEFGCVDCQGEHDDQPVTPRIVDVPLSGATVQLPTEQVGAGRYSYAEISVENPTAATLANTASWPANATLQVAGTFSGKAFTIPLSMAGSFKQALNPAVVVSAASIPKTVAVSITLPVTEWFVSNGKALDPNDAKDRAQIEANIRKSFEPAEKENGENEGEAKS